MPERHDLTRKNPLFSHYGPDQRPATDTGFYMQLKEALEAELRDIVARREYTVEDESLLDEIYSAVPFYVEKESGSVKRLKPGEPDELVQKAGLSIRKLYALAVSRALREMRDQHGGSEVLAAMDYYWSVLYGTRGGFQLPIGEYFRDPRFPEVQNPDWPTDAIREHFQQLVCEGDLEGIKELHRQLLEINEEGIARGEEMRRIQAQRLVDSYPQRFPDVEGAIPRIPEMNTEIPLAAITAEDGTPIHQWILQQEPRSGKEGQ